MLPPRSRRISSSSRVDLKRSRALKIERERSVKSASLAELRSADADAAAVTQLVNFIHQIHDIDANVRSSFFPAARRAFPTLFLTVSLAATRGPVSLESV